MENEYLWLNWRCRRGIREMDIILQEFLHGHYGALDQVNQERFKQLLDESDLDILDWLTKKNMPSNDDLKPIISLIQKSRYLK